MEKEIEYKFEHLSNLQFKFIQSENTEDIFRKLMTICDLVGVSYTSYQTGMQYDSYFDDEIFSLKKMGCVLRRRITAQGQFLVTIKYDPHLNKFGAMERFEHEFSCSPKDFDILISNRNKEIQTLFAKRFEIDVPCKKVEHQITICNERSKMPLQSAISKYLFCYDKYYYHYVKENKYSEYFYEIELELQSSHMTKDVDLIKVTESLGILLGFTRNNISKLDRGLASSKSNAETLQSLMCVCFNIVGYTVIPTENQKQILQAFNKITKEIINKYQGENTSRDLLYLPTGDGMIIAFKNKLETILPMIVAIQSAIREQNNQENEYNFQFRTGIHFGPIYKYSDVNGNLNFAGNGINISKTIMNIGDAWHIITTKECYEKLINTNSQYLKYFYKLGNLAIKNEIELEVYNLYNEGSFGNALNLL